jgi:hypothetical protein
VCYENKLLPPHHYRLSNDLLAIRKEIIKKLPLKKLEQIQPNRLIVFLGERAIKSCPPIDKDGGVLVK